MQSEEFSHFFEVKVDLFDGPIDLLLHLVKQNELPLEKLSLAQVTSQYLECLERLRYFDLEIAGEYLVIAATLVSLKSSLLLNEPVELILDEEGNLVNPHDILLKRLREAAVYREGAQELAKLPYLGIDVFESPSSLNQVAGIPVRYRQHDAILLGQAFQKLIKQASKDPSFSIVVESVSVVERMMRILDILKAGEGAIEFSKLIPDLTSKMSVIGSFIALLELCKRNVIRVMQEETFDTIVVALASADFNPQAYYSGEALSSEFDQKPQSADASANG